LSVVSSGGRLPVPGPQKSAKVALVERAICVNSY
jgi:hypothetical protein